jgi:hypothetical protein
LKDDSSTNELKQMLERMAEWQRSRATLTWAEKIRMAEAVRESLAEYRRAHPVPPDAGPAKNTTEE